MASDVSSCMSVDQPCWGKTRPDRRPVVFMIHEAVRLMCSYGTPNILGTRPRLLR